MDQGQHDGPSQGGKGTLWPQTKQLRLVSLDLALRRSNWTQGNTLVRCREEKAMWAQTKETAVEVPSCSTFDVKLDPG
jgi:hypothetical protein